MKSHASICEKLNQNRETKKCITCGIEYPLSFYYKDHRNLDGLYNRCKKCHQRATNKFRIEHKELYRQYEVKYYEESGMGVYTRQKYYKQIKARQIINNALVAGTMVKYPCVVCNDIKSEAHHEDYDKPLEIWWLCKKHHMLRHKTIKEDYNVES